MFSTVLATIASLAAISSAQTKSARSTGAYTLTDDITYDTFFDAFNWFDGSDPTQGFVQYQGMSSAIDKGLVGYLNDTRSVFLGVDHTTKDPKGRASVRLESKKFWNQGLMIVDVHHMPLSECGTWPALWLLGSDGTGSKEDMSGWPEWGEVDIMEGVNDDEYNAVTLHTSEGCTVENTTQSAASGSSDLDTSAPFTGFLATGDCDVKAANQAKNVGCSIKAPKTLSGAQMGATDASNEHVELPSYGTKFNAAGGGVYAFEWTATSMSAWFIPRDSPLHASATSINPDPSQWGTPIAHFAGKGCDYNEKFKNLKLIINTTFCGEWAGDEKVWGKTCAKKTGYPKCNDYVRDHPEAFTEAYWEIAGVKWFKKDGKPTTRGMGGEFVKTKTGRWSARK